MGSDGHETREDGQDIEDRPYSRSNTKLGMNLNPQLLMQLSVHSRLLAGFSRGLGVCAHQGL